MRRGGSWWSGGRGLRRGSLPTNQGSSRKWVAERCDPPFDRLRASGVVTFACPPHAFGLSLSKPCPFFQRRKTRKGRPSTGSGRTEWVGKQALGPLPPGPGRGDAEAEGVEADEARRVALVVAGGAFLEGDEVLVV